MYLLHTPCISAPVKKKNPAGILGKSQREPGKAQNSAGTPAGKSKNSAGSPIEITGNRESTLNSAGTAGKLTGEVLRQAGKWKWFQVIRKSAGHFPGHENVSGTVPRSKESQRDSSPFKRKSAGHFPGQEKVSG